MQYARGTITHECEECDAPFASRDDLDRHEREECWASRCEGHESLDGAHMGETVYCNGTCSR